MSKVDDLPGHRAADLRLLPKYEHEIRAWMLLHVLEYFPHPYISGLTPTDPNTETLVDQHYDELYEIMRKERPANIKKYEEVCARVNRTLADPNPAKRIGRRPKGQTPTDVQVIAGIAKFLGWEPGGIVTRDKRDEPKWKELVKATGVSPSTLSKFFQKMYPGRGYKGYCYDCRKGLIGAKLSLWQGAVRDPRLLQMLRDGQENEIQDREQED